ncbi:hypothetical protein PINS_up022674 [Pythium insidiosum]|nr:hypothetical protein PINS_up022674 [Pythium insidiosum]
MTVKGTVDYMAPEVINGKAGLAQYGEAADVYSLAMTMWDILNPGQDKFPTARNNHLHVFELVLEGQRPVLRDSLHPSLQAVMESAWHSDPRLRPSAQNVVSILEGVQEELLAVFAVDLRDELEHQTMCNKFGETVSRSFVAQHAVERMSELGLVATTAEAVRLGNALMDAGMLHHWKHDRPFEVEASDALYLFDDDNINLCQPILAPGEDGDFDEDEQIDHLVPLPVSAARARTRRGSLGASVKSSGRRHNGGGASSAKGGAGTGTGGSGNGSGGSGRASRKHSSASGSVGATSVQTGSSRSETQFEHNTLCACRKLGQRLEQPKESEHATSLSEAAHAARETAAAAAAFSDSSRRRRRRPAAAAATLVILRCTSSTRRRTC